MREVRATRLDRVQQNLRACALLLLALALGAPIAASSDAHTCERVVAASNAGLLAESIATVSDVALANELAEQISATGLYQMEGAIRLDAESGFDALIRVTSTGSCSTSSVISLEALKNESFEALQWHGSEALSVEMQEELRWAAWGTRDRLYTLDGELLVVSMASDDTPRIVSRFVDSRRKPLCLIESISEIALKVEHSEEPSLCEAIASGQLPTLPWSEQAAVPGEYRMLVGRSVDELRSLQLPVSDSESSIQLAHLQHHSGSGCGGIYEWLIEVDAATGEFKNSELSQALAPEDAQGFLPRKQFRQPRVFDYQGRAVLMGEVDGDYLAFFPTSSLPPMCKFSAQPQVRVRTQFP
ncbi:hypothetical protein [Pseudomarimonas arenosa]|uniref:Uncharacterized protein n=1 Tax=Pseudomarimonas arenosa TaxID=2774145 RepID=A0AAW3ZJ61_9GAMM|nr:hypothetical protein [Pseudomarimonas arenosa]MBD8525818.1 hypothetical protein [Pseudomarimonas arenosa]